MSKTAIEYIWNNQNSFFGLGTLGYIRLIQCLIHRFILFIGIYVYGHVNILMATVGIAYLIVVYVFFWQTDQIINRGKKRRVMWRMLKYFHIRHTKNLERIQTGNVYSKALIIFLLLNIPFNCYLLIFVLCKTITWKIQYLAGSIIAEEIICIFGIHLLFATANRQFQKSSSRFMSILAEQHQHFNSHIDLANRLKIIHYGQNFHSKNKYGFTYGKLELITMNEFLKVRLFNFYLVYNIN